MILVASIGALAFASIITGVVALFASSGAKEEIAAADSAYAARLFRSGIDQVVFRQLPVRVSVLFREDPPAKAVPAVQMLRWVYGAHLAAFVGFVGCLLASMVGHAA